MSFVVKYTTLLTFTCLLLLNLKIFNWSVISKKRPTLTLSGMLNKKAYMLTMMLLYQSLATNARVVFKLRSLLITILSKT